MTVIFFIGAHGKYVNMKGFMKPLHSRFCHEILGIIAVHADDGSLCTFYRPVAAVKSLCFSYFSIVLPPLFSLSDRKSRI